MRYKPNAEAAFPTINLMILSYKYNSEVISQTNVRSL